MSEPDSTFAASNGGAVMMASGTVLMINAQEPLEIGIPIKDSAQSLVLELSFKEDKANTAGRFEMKGAPETPFKILFTMINFSAPMGGGPSEPVKLWTRAEAAIFLVLRVYTVPDGRHTVSFTFYEKTEAAK